MKGIKRLYSILTFLPLVVSIFACPILPQKIPAHYNLAGEVDRWGSRQEILIIPILTMVLGWIFRRWIVSTMKKQPENSERALYIGGISMLFVFNGLFFVMLYTSFAVVEHLANPENHTNHQYSGRNHADSVRKHHAQGKAQWSVWCTHQMEHGKRYLLESFSEVWRNELCHYRYPDYCGKPDDGKSRISEYFYGSDDFIGRGILYRLFLSDLSKIWEKLSAQRFCLWALLQKCDTQSA